MLPWVEVEGMSERDLQNLAQQMLDNGGLEIDRNDDANVEHDDVEHDD